MRGGGVSGKGERDRRGPQMFITIPGNPAASAGPPVAGACLWAFLRWTSVPRIGMQDRQGGARGGCVRFGQGRMSTLFIEWRMRLSRKGDIGAFFRASRGLEW